MQFANAVNFLLHPGEFGVELMGEAIESLRQIPGPVSLARAAVRLKCQCSSTDMTPRCHKGGQIEYLSHQALRWRLL